MASKLVMDAVTARLATSWSDCPVIDPNTTSSSPADGTEFLTVQYPVANETHISLGQPGQRVFRETGAIRFVLSVPRGQGLAVGAQHADDLRALFRAAQFSGITCEGASPAAIDESNADGSYFILRIIVPYFVDVQA
jgi:hypothetical protein